MRAVKFILGVRMSSLPPADADTSTELSSENTSSNITIKDYDPMPENEEEGPLSAGDESPEPPNFPKIPLASELKDDERPFTTVQRGKSRSLGALSPKKIETPLREARRNTTTTGPRIRGRDMPGADHFRSLPAAVGQSNAVIRTLGYADIPAGKTPDNIIIRPTTLTLEDINALSYEALEQFHRPYPKTRRRDAETTENNFSNQEPLRSSRNSKNISRHFNRRGRRRSAGLRIIGNRRANSSSEKQVEKVGIHTNIDFFDSTQQKKGLNFNSPDFTPGAGVANGLSRANAPTLSSQAAAAAPFTPRALGAATPIQQQESDPMSSMNLAHIRDFTPSYDIVSTQQTGANGTTPDAHIHYDPFNLSAVNHALPAAPYNPYTMDDSNGLAADPMASYYPAQNNYVAAAQPLQYHLYAPQGPHRDDLLPYQRQAHEFFIPEELRQTLQRRAEATLQVMPNSQLPNPDPYHSLVALDTNQQQNTQLFAYSSWVYKALSSKNGHYYCLRRLEGYRPTNDRAIRSVKDWRRVDGTHVVRIHDAFTTRAFGDSSLVIVTDFHPLSKTLSEVHPISRNRGITNVPEAILWSYIVQISLALKEVHQYNLAARCIDPSKVLLTDKNRIRLNACAILDVTQFEAAHSLIELQQEDFQQFGKLILSIATHVPVAQLRTLASLDQLARDYSAELVKVVRWLVSPSSAVNADGTSSLQLKSVAQLLQSIALRTADVLTRMSSAQDIYTAEFAKELENSRLVRLVIKLGNINERPEYAHNEQWSETGDRYVLKLMRDYIFHQVDAQGNPMLDLGFIVRCLNCLDAGSDEKIMLESRDGNNVFVVTWRELRSCVAKSWGELLNDGGRGASGGSSSSTGGSGGRGKR